MRTVTLIFILLISIAASSQCLKDSVRYIERMPKCLDCNIEIETYINNNYTIKSDISTKDIMACFEIDSIGVVQDIYIEEILNPELNQVIKEAILSINTWIPAYQRNNPVTSHHFIRFRVDNRIKIYRHDYISLDYNQHQTIKQDLYFNNNFENNSHETISHVSSKKLLQYIIDNLNLSNSYHNSLQKRRKSQRIKVQAKGTETIGVLIIPELRYKKSLECLNCKNLNFKSVPIDYEVFLIIIGKTEDEIFIHVQKKNSARAIEKKIIYEQYSFNELNMLINSLKKN